MHAIIKHKQEAFLFRMSVINSFDTIRSILMSKIKSMLASRRFWVALSGLIVVCADALFGEGTVDPTTVTSVVVLCGAWIVGDSLRITE